MTDSAVVSQTEASGWLSTSTVRIAKGLAGMIASLIAVKTIVYQPDTVFVFDHQDHILRILAFAALTVWTTFTFGIKRRGLAAITVLAFATFVETVLVPAQGAQVRTIASANLGIVLAYCGMQLYWLNLNRQP